MSQQPPPTLSPDGKFYWDGARWVPVPVAPVIVQARKSALGQGCLIGGLLLLGLFVVIEIRAHTGPPAFTATVDPWHPGDAVIGGRVTNQAGYGCTHTTIHLAWYDHNGNRVRSENPDVGDTQPGRTTSWTAGLSTLGIIPDPIPDSAVTLSVLNVTCEDSH